jgi:hypothetical protein
LGSTALNTKLPVASARARATVVFFLRTFGADTLAFDHISLALVSFLA